MSARAPLWVLVALLVAPRAAAALELRDPLDCPGKAQLQTALDRRAPGLDGQLELQRASDGAVRVTWNAGARHFARELHLSRSDCPAAAETVALLVDAWRRNLPTEARPDALADAARVRVSPERTAPTAVEHHQPALDKPRPQPPETPPVPEAAPDAGPTVAESVPDAGSAIAPPVAETDAGSVATAPPPPAPDAGTQVAMLEPPSAPTELRELAPAGEPAHGPWSLRVGLEGRGALGLGTSGQFASGAVAGELSWRDFGAQLDLAVDTAQHGTLPPGTITARRQTLALRGLIRLRPGSASAFRLRLTLGPLLERLDAQSARYDTNQQQTVYAFGLAAGLAAEAHWGRLTLGIGPEFELLADQTRFTISGVSGDVPMPRAWVGLGAGLRFAIF